MTNEEKLLRRIDASLNTIKYLLVLLATPENAKHEGSYQRLERWAKSSLDGWSDMLSSAKNVEDVIRKLEDE